MRRWRPHLMSGPRPGASKTGASVEASRTRRFDAVEKEKMDEEPGYEVSERSGMSRRPDSDV